MKEFKVQEFKVQCFRNHCPAQRCFEAQNARSAHLELLNPWTLNRRSAAGWPSWT